MHQDKNLIGKIIHLLIFTAVFGYSICKKVVLPTNKRKGNILSSFFIFFIGFIERINHYEHGFNRLGGLFKLKSLKNSLIVVISFLFILSLFEWTGNKRSNLQEEASRIQLLISTNSKSSITVITVVAIKPAVNWFYLKYQHGFHCESCLASSTKRYLLTRRMRI